MCPSKPHDISQEPAVPSLRVAVRLLIDAHRATVEEQRTAGIVDKFDVFDVANPDYEQALDVAVNANRIARRARAAVKPEHLAVLERFDAAGNQPHEVSQELAGAIQLVRVECINCGGTGRMCLKHCPDICEDCTNCEGEGTVLGWDKPFHEVVDQMRAKRAQAICRPESETT